jgi:hypothetical protein
VHAALARFADVHLCTLLANAAFAGVPPSLLAAAVLVLGCRDASLAPEWPQVLAGVTGLPLLHTPAGGAPHRGDTPLAALAAQAAAALGLPHYAPSAYQCAIAEGLDGMLRMDHRPSTLASTVPPECAPRPPRVPRACARCAVFPAAWHWSCRSRGRHGTQ